MSAFLFVCCGLFWIGLWSWFTCGCWCLVYCVALLGVMMMIMVNSVGITFLLVWFRTLLCFDFWLCKWSFRMASCGLLLSGFGLLFGLLFS